MVKGVTRRIVEIKETGSDYFERAIFFVKMDGSRSTSAFTLSQEAQRIINKYASGMPFLPVDKKQQTKKRTLLVLKLLVAAAIGAVAAVIFMNLL